MTTTTNCPACSAALELPEEYSLGDHAECPNCGGRFGLSEVVPRPLHRVVLVEPAEPEPAAEVAVTPSETTEPLPSIAEPAGIEPAPTLSELIAEVDPYGTVPGDADLGKEVREELSKQEEPPSETASPASWEPPEFDDPFAPEEETAEQVEPEAESGASAFEEIPQLEGEPTSSEFRIPALHETQSVADADTLQLNLDPEPRRGKSPLKLLVGTVAGGAVGIVGGLFALLWILGPEGDYLQVAQYLPEAALPPSFHSASAPLAHQAVKPEPSPVAEPDSLAADDQQVVPQQVADDSDVEPPVRRDSEVVAASAASEPASIEEPVAPKLPEPKLMKHALAFLEQQDIAEAARPELANGTLDDPATVPVKGSAYIAICSFAEQCGFVNRGDLDTRMVTRSIVAKDFFRDILDVPVLRDEIARITSRWWGLAEPPNRGIFYSGVVESVRAVGPGTLMMVSLQTDQGPLIVPTYAKGSGRRIGSRVGVVGVALDGSDAALNSLTGEFEKLVAAHFTFRVSN